MMGQEEALTGRLGDDELRSVVDSLGGIEAVRASRSETCRIVAELVDLRAASAADRERVYRVVRESAIDVLYPIGVGQAHIPAMDIATRVANQLLANGSGGNPGGEHPAHETQKSERGAPSPERAEIDRVARILIAAWEQAESETVNISYMATFADMARAVIRDRQIYASQGGQPASATQHGAATPGKEATAGHAVAMSADELRGLQLMRLHLDEGGHDWSRGTAMADVSAATALLDRLIAAPCQVASPAADDDQIRRLRSALREALSCWRYPCLTAEEKARKDEIWSLVYPIDERDEVDVAEPQLGPTAHRAEHPPKPPGPIPAGWEPLPGDRAKAAEMWLSADAEADRFRAYHAAKGSVLTDWDAAFRTWLGKAGHPPAQPTVCSTCNDTHLMPLGEREVMCTRCPTPCEACRGRTPGFGPSAYCATTPCPCACHRSAERPTTDFGVDQQADAIAEAFMRRTAPDSRRTRAGWRAGIEASIRSLEAMGCKPIDLSKSSYFAAIDDAIVNLRAMLECGTERQGDRVMGDSAERPPEPTALDADVCRRLASEAIAAHEATHREEPECGFADRDLAALADGHEDACPKKAHRHAVVEAWMWAEVNLPQVARQLTAAAEMAESLDEADRAALISHHREARGLDPDPDCTGVTARWCPRCGACACGEGENVELNDPSCPLHAPGSPHAEVAASVSYVYDAPPARLADVEGERDAARDEAAKLRARVAELEARSLTADEVRAVVLPVAMTGVCEAISRMMGPTYWHDNPSAHGTFERVADAIAARVAEQLAGRALPAPEAGDVAAPAPRAWAVTPERVEALGWAQLLAQSAAKRTRGEDQSAWSEAADREIAAMLAEAGSEVR